jgi:hypothetical protein
VEARGERRKLLRVSRRVVAAGPNQDGRPEISLDPAQRAAPGGLGPAGQHGDARPVSREILGHPVPAGRVAEPGVHDRLLGRLVTYLLQPPRRPGAGTGGVHHHIGGQLYCGAIGPHKRPDAGDAPRVWQEAGHLAARQEGCSWILFEAGADAAFDEGTARGAHGYAGAEARQAAGGERRYGVRGLVEERAAGGGELSVEVREEFFEDLRPPRRQAVKVAGLGHALAGYGIIRQRVPLDERHPVEALGERPSREQARDAGAHDQGVGAPFPGSPCREHG